MRRALPLLAASALVAALAGLAAAGCGTFDVDCLQHGLCSSFRDRDAGPDDAGNDGSVTPACAGDPTADPTLVTNDCGLFVRGDPTDTDDAPGAGTKEQPFKTIQAAITAATGKWIFVCAKNPFSESLTIAKDKVELYGGFNCSSGWAYQQDGRTTLEGPADTIALTISGEGAKVQNFIIHAGDATKPGGSSIAALVNATNPALSRCELDAGKPGDGLPGASGGAMPAQAGASGNSGGGACSAATVSGADAVTNSCGATASIGGKGGDGESLKGSPGQAGLPNDIGGAAGQGDDGSAGWSCDVNMGNGGDGADGSNGLFGAGAPMSDLGVLAPSGFTPVSGGDGLPGLPGQGGGGGGGVKGGALCNGKPGSGGASGGSGGSGGCGGAGGKGGQGGGSSIALVSLMSPALTLTSVTLHAADGGKGGSGGDGQIGGAPGMGGAGGTSGGIAGLGAGCRGGSGGAGGTGGPGGGGRGGHSIGIAYVGQAPAIVETSIVVGKAGSGGQGGDMNAKSNQGAGGAAAPTQEFIPQP